MISRVVEISQGNFVAAVDKKGNFSKQIQECVASKNFKETLVCFLREDVNYKREHSLPGSQGLESGGVVRFTLVGPFELVDLFVSRSLWIYGQTLQEWEQEVCHVWNNNTFQIITDATLEGDKKEVIYKIATKTRFADFLMGYQSHMVNLGEGGMHRWPYDCSDRGHCINLSKLFLQSPCFQMKEFEIYYKRNKLNVLGDMAMSQFLPMVRQFAKEQHNLK